ncbi:MAG: hypothetical protein Q8N72_00425 [Candidatus Omnitrophota bacterium]|nr:hypothetical protein [Candidatus Omnitrophota bacterium]
MKRGILVLVFLCSCVLVLWGCAGVLKKDASSKEGAFLEPQAALKFSDIPAPTGFKFLPEESYSFESTGVRVGILKYQGKADVEQVVNFYKDQMPLYNWNLLNVMEYGERLLNFEREQESCIINLASQGKNITVTVSLGPKSAIRPKKSDKPVK